MRDIVTQFICEAFPAGAQDRRIEGDTSLLESGLIDSTGVLELVEFLESRFGIAVDDADLVPENLDSIDRICRFLSRKGAGAAPADGPARASGRLSG